MLLHKITFKPYYEQALNNAGHVHSLLHKAFADHQVRINRKQGGAGVLWRHEGTGVLLVVSRVTPSIELMDTDAFLHIESKALLPQGIKSGGIYKFRMDGNPITRSRMGDTFIRDKVSQIKWLHRKLEENGARIEQVNIVDTFFTKRKMTPMVLVRFDGTLTVTDDKKLLDAALYGVGRSKSFGAGLLSLSL